MSQSLIIFVLPTGNNEIIKEICHLWFSVSKKHSDDDSFKACVRYFLTIFD